MIGAESIELFPKEPCQTGEPYRAVYAACSAVIDGAAYRFSLIHQSGALDDTGKQIRACWSWIDVQGPHQSRPNEQVSAQFAAYEPFRWVNTVRILKPRGVRQAIAQWFKQPEVRAAWGKSFREEDEFRGLQLRKARTK